MPDRLDGYQRTPVHQAEPEWTASRHLPFALWQGRMPLFQNNSPFQEHPACLSRCGALCTLNGVTEQSLRFLCWGRDALVGRDSSPNAVSLVSVSEVRQLCFACSTQLWRLQLDATYAQPQPFTGSPTHTIETHTARIPNHTCFRTDPARRARRRATAPESPVAPAAGSRSRAAEPACPLTRAAAQPSPPPQPPLHRLGIAGPATA